MAETRIPEVLALQEKGKLVITHYQEECEKKGYMPSDEEQLEIMPMLSGAVAGRITEVLSAQEIVDEMVLGAAAALDQAQGFRSKL